MNKLTIICSLNIKDLDNFPIILDQNKIVSQLADCLYNLIKEILIQVEKIKIK